MKKLWMLFCLMVVPVLTNAQLLKVVDDKGNAVPQAVVVILNTSDGNRSSFLTDAAGIVSAPVVDSLNNVSVSHISFENWTGVPGKDGIIRLRPRQINLNELIITAEYTPKSAGESIHPVKVITRSEIQDQAATRLDQTLQQQAGIRIAHDAVMGSSVSLNGMFGQNVKLLVDGVPVIGRVDGNIDLSQISLSNVERIEVVNGPMAASYGTDAAGGVINVITQQASDSTLQAGFNLLYGSEGEYDIDGNAGIKIGNSSLLASVGRNFFDGWSGTKNVRVQEWKPREQWNGGIKYGFDTRRTHFNYGLNVSDEMLTDKGYPKVSPYFAYAFDSFYQTRRITNQISGNFLNGENHELDFILSYSNWKRIKSTFRKDLVTLDQELIPGDDQQDTSRFDAWHLRASWTNHNPSSRLNYQSGIDCNYETAFGKRIQDTYSSNGDYAVFASAEIIASKKLKFKPALRYGFNTDFSSPLIPSLMIRWQTLPELVTRFSYGQGFRAPSIKERLLYFVDVNHNVQGNKNLLPEDSHNFYFDLDFSPKSKRKSSINTGLHAFYSDITNLITLAQPDPSSSLYTYINIGAYATEGAGFELRYNRAPVSVTAAYTYTGRTSLAENSEAAGRYFYYSSDASLNLNYEWIKSGIRFSMFMKYNGRVPGYFMANDSTLVPYENSPYGLLDFSAQRSWFGKNLTLSAGVKNLLDVTDVNALVQGSAHSDSTGQSMVGMGRNYFFRVNYILKSSHRKKLKNSGEVN